MLQISDTAAIVFEQRLKSSAASQDATPALMRKARDGAPPSQSPPPRLVPMVFDELVTLHAGRVGSQQLTARLITLMRARRRAGSCCCLFTSEWGRWGGGGGQEKDATVSMLASRFFLERSRKVSQSLNEKHSEAEWTGWSGFALSCSVLFVDWLIKSCDT